MHGPKRSLSFFCIVLILNVHPVSLNAQNLLQWQSLGPPGGHVSSMSIDPTDPQIIYAGTRYTLLYKSTDGGSSTRLLSDSLYTSDIAINPLDSRMLYMSLYRSVDAGGTWRRMSHGGAGYAINRLNPRRLFTASFGTQVWTTTDGGDAWFRLRTFQYLNSVHIATSDTNVLYAVAQDTLTGPFIFKSTDAGTSWFPTSGQPGCPTNKVIIHTQDPNIVYAWGNGICKTTNGGMNWSTILQNAQVNDVDMSNQDPDVLYAATGDYLFGPPSSILKTTDGGSIWATCNLGLPSDSNRTTQTIEVDPFNSSVAYVGTFGFGVYKTTNGGVNWSQSKLVSAPIADVYLDNSSPFTLYVADRDQGILRTTNNGINWTRMNSGLGQTYGSGFQQFLFDPSNRNNAYAVALNVGLFKSTDRGETWLLTSMRSEFDSYVNTVAVHPHNSDTLYVGKTGFQQRDAYRSTDRGATWTNLNLTNGTDGVKTIVFDQSHADVIYVCTNEKGIFKTSDGGTSWRRINNGLIMTTSTLYASVNAISISGGRGDTLYTIQDYPSMRTGGVFRSINAGESWLRIDQTLPDLSCQDITWSNGKIYVATGKGLFRTTNEGATWEVLRLGHVGRVTLSQQNNQVYAATGSGLYCADATVSVPEKSLWATSQLNLGQNYPNPFNPSTTIDYAVPSDGYARLKVYDVLGQELFTLVDQFVATGRHSVSFDASTIPSGIYLYRLQTRSFAETKKMILLR